MTLELSGVSGVTWSSRSIRSGLAELHVHSLPGTISSAISHSRRIYYADFLVDRSRTARLTQLRDSRLANFTVGCFCTHRDYCAIYLVRKRKGGEWRKEEKIFKIKHLKIRIKILKSFKCYITLIFTFFK